MEDETESEIYGDNYCIVWGKVETGKKVIRTVSLGNCNGEIKKISNLSHVQ